MWEHLTSKACPRPLYLWHTVKLIQAWPRGFSPLLGLSVTGEGWRRDSWVGVTAGLCSTEGLPPAGGVFSSHGGRGPLTPGSSARKENGAGRGVFPYPRVRCLRERGLLELGTGHPGPEPGEACFWGGRMGAQPALGLAGLSARGHPLLFNLCCQFPS